MFSTWQLGKLRLVVCMVRKYPTLPHRPPWCGVSIVASSMLDLRNESLNRVVEMAAVRGASGKGEKRGREKKKKTEEQREREEWQSSGSSGMYSLWLSRGYLLGLEAVMQRQKRTKEARRKWSVDSTGSTGGGVEAPAGVVFCCSSGGDPGLGMEEQRNWSFEDSLPGHLAGVACPGTEVVCQVGKLRQSREERQEGVWSVKSKEGIDSKDMG